MSTTAGTEQVETIRAALAEVAAEVSRRAVASAAIRADLEQLHAAMGVTAPWPAPGPRNVRDADSLRTEPPPAPRNRAPRAPWPRVTHP
ncbi:MAG: hypothetical protein L0H96_20345 [Humibacillus sp.]|nr:hypothetical protein [Humibacillus sp.]MDN5779247.1 hypothetical protein [Humibacillus sp.]